MSAPIIEVNDLSRTFHTGRGMFQRGQDVQAVKQVTLQVPAGSTFGLVGESGSGKTTVAKIVCGLESIDSGHVRVADFDLGRLRRRDLKPFRRLTQMVFQDPLASLNPYWRIGSLVGEGLRIHGLYSPAERRDRVVFLLESCGLTADMMDRHPHEFSGGQRQRISIARALAVEPKVLVLDEPVSSLDVSIQAQILTLLQELQRQFGLTYLFIGHNLAVVEGLCDRIAVMYRGEVVEEGTTDAVIGRPEHPYTVRLIAATPVPDPTKRKRIA
ncbi:ATP-binding cassette domain-containing protein [Jatrophihabitans cynanchi]|uniref:ATP-binding cassette domain-containing protein n=1 Tax=Jatrophihabitans cynanchi TaxID=2944128 RepID=A0ABY7JT00_9ACTN|nr:ATP-binding cassette domain-containing protein [Jatrophihabitans sp. SB3-54]WAX55160.1 ATP-binding cassette domain-containing protein [Jatrophihabitans sp. SB3-54]